MIRTFITVAASVAVVALAPMAFAQGQFGTADEATALLLKAAAAVKADRDLALGMFNKGEGGVRDRDLYPFCWDATTGIFNAHVTKTLLGTDIRALKEKDGSPLGMKIFNAVKADTITTVS